MKADLVQIHHAQYQEDLPFWVSLTAGRDPILEVGCGHGRVTLPLLESGRRVIGVDRDPAALKFLDAELASLSGEIRDRAVLIEGDILDFQAEFPFGGVIIPCNTLSTFKPEQRASLFTGLFNLLDSGGILAASLPNPVHLRAEMGDLLAGRGASEPEIEAVFRHPDTGLPVQVSSRQSAAGAALRWDWIYDELFPDGQVRRTAVSTVHYPASLETYRDELRTAGFRDTEILGDFDGGPYSPESPYLILISTR